MEDNEIIEIVLAIRPELPKLLGEEAQITLDQIDSLLHEVSSDEEAIDKMWKILTKSEVTRSWATDYQSSVFSNPTRNASSLPGDRKDTSAPTYHCNAPSCQFTWSRSSIGRPIPVCPDHNQILVLQKP